MKFTAAFIMATAAVTSATAINMEPAAPAKWDNLRIQFSHDYDCKWRNKNKIIAHSPPECNSKDYKKLSVMFDKKDETGNKCFSPKDLGLLPGQETWHSFSFCLPPRLEKQGCYFRMYNNVHCDGNPSTTIDTKAIEGTDEFMKNHQCRNTDTEGENTQRLDEGGARSLRLDCPKRESECDDEDMEESDYWKPDEEEA